MEVIWVAPLDASAIEEFQAQRPALTTFAKNLRNGGFFSLQLSGASNQFRDTLETYLETKLCAQLADICNLASTKNLSRFFQPCLDCFAVYRKFGDRL